MGYHASDDKGTPVRFSISGLEAAILITALFKAGETGLFLSADETLAQVCAQLEHYRQPIKKKILQEALYVCNMQMENGTFWHPQGTNFDGFIKKILPSDFSYDRTYNLIERNDEDGKR